VHASALAGFILFYALENMVTTSRMHQQGQQENVVAYRADIGGYAGYCAMMSYLLVADAIKSLISLVLYRFAMFLHYWLVDHSLRREHAEPYDRAGRWIIASGIVAGWVVGSLELSSDVLVPTLMGFIGVVLS
jgi:hypothetical protein